MTSIEAMTERLEALCEKRGSITQKALVGLADYETVFEQILENVGSAFQSDIVEATGLSKSKVSCILSTMHAKGKIQKIRHKKENLIRFVAPSTETG